MAKKKIKFTKEELQRDEVLELSERALIWLRMHGNKLLTGVTVIFLAWAAVIFYNQRQEATLRSASDMLYSAIQQYENTLQQHEWATPGRTEGMREVVDLTQEIIDQYGNTPVARNALFLMGNAYYFAGDEIGSVGNTQEAVRVFNEYEEWAARDGDAFEQAAALLALGYAHENMYLLLTASPEEATQALVAAMDYYNRLENLGQEAGFLRYEAMNARARLLAFQGQTERAEELYREVVRARYRPRTELGPDAPDVHRTLQELRFLAGQFTTGNTARMQLQRLGVDVEEIEDQVRAEQRAG